MRGDDQDQDDEIPGHEEEEAEVIVHEACLSNWLRDYCADYPLLDIADRLPCWCISQIWYKSGRPSKSQSLVGK
jgi:hypothetical protein